MTTSPAGSGARPDTDSRTILDPASSTRVRPRVLLIIAAAAIAALLIGVAAFFGLTQAGSIERLDRNMSIGMILEPTSLDVRANTGTATDQILIDNVYQGLIGIHSDTVSEIVPVLATELPTISADGLEYRFTVRDDVTFHSGTALSVDDVVNSLRETLTDDQVGFTPRIEANGSQGVAVTLSEPNSNLMWILANRPGLIRESGENSSLEDSANGTGPYTFGEWERGDHLTLKKNQQYWGTAATLDAVEFRFYPEGRDVVDALQKGELDVHTALLPSLRPEFEKNTGFRLENAAGSDVFTLAFNSARAPLDDERVRRALSLAIDAEAIITAQHGDGKPLGGPITEQEPGYEDLTSPDDYDPATARTLLKESGRANLGLTITVPSHYDMVPLDLVKSQLAEVGVSVKIKQVAFSSWFEEVYSNHDYQLSYVDHAEARSFGNYADPDYYFGYDNSSVQDLYARSLATTDENETNRLLREAAEMVSEDAPAKWIFNYTPTNVVGTHVTGFPTANTNSRINLAGVSLQR